MTKFFMIFAVSLVFLSPAVEAKDALVHKTVHKTSQKECKNRKCRCVDCKCANCQCGKVKTVVRSR